MRTYEKEAELMAKLSTFVICEAINNIPTPNGNSFLQMNSPQIALRPEFIPSSYSFGVLFGVRDINLCVPT